MDRVARPLDEEGKLRIDLKILDSELVPGQHCPVRQMAMALDRRATHPLLDRSKIINRDHPTQPTPAFS